MVLKVKKEAIDLQELQMSRFSEYVAPKFRKHKYTKMCKMYQTCLEIQCLQTEKKKLWLSHKLTLNC